MRILLDYEIGAKTAEELRSLGDEGISVTSCGVNDGFRFKELLSTAEVVWHVLKPINASVIASAPHLRLIQKLGVGVDTIDLNAARERGIAVCNAPGTNSAAVAELALALMLSCMRRLDHFGLRRTRDWSYDPKIVEDLGELNGSTVGLVGFGAIPRILAPALNALGANVIFTEKQAVTGSSFQQVTFEELLRSSNVVSLHIPSTVETRKLMNRQAFEFMKPGSILINTARGDLVDEDALCTALKSGRVVAAGLDVLCNEPPDPGHPLLRMKSVVMTPHIAWLTNAALWRGIRVAIENSRRITAGKDLLHRVI
jgi:phosphoglycerate dehydrogenase-like enzyme